MKFLLKTIFTQIKTVPAIKWVDEDFGQIDQYEDKPPVQFPCALVTIDELYDSLGGDACDQTSTITVRVAHSRLGNRSGMAPGEAIDLTLAKLDVAEDVKLAIQGFKITSWNSIVYLTGMATERRTDGIAVKTLTFTVTN